jgi:hypothetical protein
MFETAAPASCAMREKALKESCGDGWHVRDWYPESRSHIRPKKPFELLMRQPSSARKFH